MPLKGKHHTPEALLKIRLARAKQVFSSETRQLWSNQRKGKTHPWCKKRRITKSGYVDLWMPNHPEAKKSGYVLEHRFVVYEHIKRRLSKDEVIHHINEDRQDNRLENLRILDRKTHLFTHFDPELHSKKIVEIRKLKFWNNKKRD